MDYGAERMMSASVVGQCTLYDIVFCPSLHKDFFDGSLVKFHVEHARRTLFLEAMVTCPFWHAPNLRQNDAVQA